MQVHTRVRRRLKVMVLAVLFVLLGIVVALSVQSCINVHQNSYSYIRAMAEEHEITINNEFDSSLLSIRGYAEVMGQNVRLDNYVQYMTFDQIMYIRAGGEEAERLKDCTFMQWGLQGKYGIEIDFDRMLSDTISLVFYAPVVRENQISGVLIGQVFEDTVKKILHTDCYGTLATSFLTTSTGNIIFASEGSEEYIGQNLFTDYYENAELLNISLDRLSNTQKTFDTLQFAMYNGADVGYSVWRNGNEKQIAQIMSLSYGGFSVVEIFPPSMFKELVDEKIRTAQMMTVLIVLFMLFFVGPIAQKYGRYEAMQMEAAQSEAANQAKSEFLSKMSHDMRTPLNGILGMADIALRSKNDPAKTTDCLEKIKSSGHYLLNLINEVLDLNSIESGKTPLHEEPVNIPEMLGEEKIILQNMAAERHITLTYENKLKHDHLIADRMALQKITLNLVSNAVKYTPEGGKIWVRYEEEQVEDPAYRRFYLTVQDTGIGMTKEFMTRMFRPYERQEDVRTSKTQGTGLGLSIVKALVDKMGGTITVNSEQGKGSTFTIKVRLKLAEEKEKKAEAKKEPAALSLDDLHLKGRRALLVEDNALNAEIGQALLSLSGVSVETAENGKAAIDQFLAHPEGYYDIIFMDIQMPVMDGYEATKKIRTLEREDANVIPIVAMTANAYAEDVRRSLNSGMDDHLAKPIDQGKLAAVLKRFLGGEEA